MPYPPPAPPPTLGIFQAIGKVQEIPDPTGHTGEFLETDGLITNWEPVGGGALPDQTGHAGQFLTTDGVDASWATVAGGGIIAIGAVTTPTANAAIISGGNTLQLGVADKDNPGAITAVAQTFAGEKLFLDGAAAQVQDLRNYGGVPIATEDPTQWTHDLASAYYNALAEGRIDLTGGGPGTFYLSEGYWYTSMPICVPAGLSIIGQGRDRTQISRGFALSTDTPGLTRGYVGPLAVTGYPFAAINAAVWPTFTTSLLTGPGNALVLNEATATFDRPNQWVLNDAVDWVKIGSSLQTAIGIQCQIKVDGPAPTSLIFERALFASQGPTGLWGAGTTLIDRAFGFFIYTPDNVHWRFRCCLTTSADWDNVFNPQARGTLHTIDSTVNITLGQSYNLELAYDGSFFDFYVDGVNIGHVAATGGITQAGWEGVCIGTAGTQLLEQGGLELVTPSIDGAIDSLRLSTAPRHTGTGSFTPPTSKYSWDSTTAALYNFTGETPTYQPVDRDGNNVGGLYYMPSVQMGVARGPAFPQGNILSYGLTGPIPHYVSVGAASYPFGQTWRDLTLNSNFGGACYYGLSPALLRMDNVQFLNGTFGGFIALSSAGFYINLNDCRAINCLQWGFKFFGNATNLTTNACGIGIHLLSGQLYNCNQQPSWNAWCTLLIGPGGNQSQIYLNSMTCDTEFWSYSRTPCQSIIWGNFLSNMVSENCAWVGLLSNTACVMILGAFPGVGSTDNKKWTSIHDTFYGQAVEHTLNDTVPPNDSMIFVYAPSYAGKALLISPVITASTDIVPHCNFPGYVTILDPTNVINWSGLSITDVAAKNLAGTFSTRAPYTFGNASFAVPEHDTNYNVHVTPQSWVGAAPAATSTTVVEVEKRTDGFTVFFEASPGATTEVTYAWEVIRIFPVAELNLHLPAAPSTWTNPFAGSTTAPFWVSAALLPVAVDQILPFNSGSAEQVVYNVGVTPGGTDWQKFSFIGNGQGYETGVAAAGTQDFDAFVKNRQLVSLWSPGVHVIYYGVESGLFHFGVDGQFFQAGLATYPGPQATPIHIGELYDASLPLTTATFLKFQMGENLAQVLNNDPGIGPGHGAAAMTEGLMLGGRLLQGAADTSGNGGFGQQIGSNRYGTAFYHMGNVFSGSTVESIATSGVRGLGDIWVPWQGNYNDAQVPVLVGALLIAGIQDLQAGHSATDIWNGVTVGSNSSTGILGLLEGKEASITWDPPTSFLTPTDQRAIVVLTGARGPGTANYVVDGTPIASPWVTDSLTTATNLLAACIADVTINGTFDPTLNNDPAGSSVTLHHRVPGTVGNGLPVTCDGGGGGYCFGSVGGVPSTGLNVDTISGLDNYIILGSTRFASNFDTDAATTVNNLVTDINASGAVNPFVTAANVANQCVITYNTKGVLGSQYPAESHPLNGGGFLPLGNTFSTLQGGYDGLVTKAIGTILLCNVNPAGGSAGWSGAKEIQRGLLNGLINAYVAAGVTIVDIDTLLTGAPNTLNVAYDSGDGVNVNTAGHTALYGLIEPLLP